MNNNVRIIARLDIKGPNLVKGIHLEGLRVLGDPGCFAECYYRQGVDELFYQDVVASLYGRNSLDNFISETAKKTFIPLTVGGGIRNIDDIRRVLRAGADKVCINTAAVNNPSFISEAAEIFGSSTIVVAIEVIKDENGEYLAFTDNGREHTGLNAVEWAVQVAELGAGEICLTSVDMDGTGEGFDSDLVYSVSTAVTIPVIAHGGGSSPDDITNCILDGKADAVAIASVLHYGLIKDQRCIDFPKDSSEGNKEYLSNRYKFNKIKPSSIQKIKDCLFENGIEHRVVS